MLRLLIGSVAADHIHLQFLATHAYFFSFAAVTTVILHFSLLCFNLLLEEFFMISCTAEGMSDGATIQNIKWYHNQTKITAEVIQQRNTLSKIVQEPFSPIYNEWIN